MCATEPMHCDGALKLVAMGRSPNPRQNHLLAALHTDDYAQLLPDLFQLNVGNVYVEMAGEQDPGRVLDIIAETLRPDQRVFVGVIDPIDPAVESREQVRDRVLEAADRLPQDRLGTTDDCGFSPFGDDDSTSRDVAFEKIRARIEGTKLAEERLGL